jgi:hypothetical protein
LILLKEIKVAVCHDSRHCQFQHGQRFGQGIGRRLLKSAIHFFPNLTKPGIGLGFVIAVAAWANRRRRAGEEVLQRMESWPGPAFFWPTSCYIFAPIWLYDDCKKYVLPDRIVAVKNGGHRCFRGDRCLAFGPGPGRKQ